MTDSWDRYWDNPAERVYWEKPDPCVIDLVRNLDRSQAKDVLDLGCGTGRHAVLLAESGFNVTALDSSQRGLAHLQTSAQAKGLTVRVIQGNYSDDLFPPASFDLVLAFNVLYHGYYSSIQAAIELVHQMLRPGGLFFFSCPSRQDDKYGNGELVAPHTYRPLNSVHPGDIHYFSDEADIASLLTGFHLISLTTFDHNWEEKGARRFSSYWRVLAGKIN
jgi:tellurite methyltransferase